MPTISAFTDAEPFSEDQTLLTLYSLAGEESGGFVTFRPHFFHEIGKAFFSRSAVSSPDLWNGQLTSGNYHPLEMVTGRAGDLDPLPPADC